MLRKLTIRFLLLSLLLFGVACGSSETAVLSVDSAETAISSSDSEEAPTRVRLNNEYSNAASIQTQLSVGTLQLEDSELAIDESLAGEILPLWQALQALGQNESTATAELTAVLNQIQDTMQPEQIEAISAMELTDESLQEMLTDGTIQLGRGGRPGGQGGADGAQGGAGGQGGQGGAGGGRGGVLGGGGQGGGQGGLGGADPDEIATRRAERFGEAGAGDFLGNATTGAVVRLLAVKAGVEIQGQGGPNGQGGQGGNPQGIIVDVVSEALGMSAEELNGQLDEGATYADLISEADLDIETLRADLETALSESDFGQRGNVEQIIGRILGEE